MKKISIFAISALFLFPSCVSSKKYNELKKIYSANKDLLDTATVKLNSCLSEQAVAKANADAFQARFSDLQKTNNDLIQSSKDLTMLTTKGATNLEKSLESLQERDLKITRLQDAISKKDSVTLALVTSLKKEVGINDPDIEINVEKGVVFISIADKLLFKSGSYNITTKANEVLGKVATVVNGKPDFECMVEGHTDNVPYNNGVLLDNWDLSVKRSTAIVRKLESLGVAPGRLIAAGRSHYVPLVPNDTRENRSKNRRTRIVVLPKIDQFYDMIEKEMKNLAVDEGN
jgi:chemotaxis protein MotB